VRIAVVFDCLYPWTTGGAERIFRSYAEEWAAEGHEVTYLTRLQWPVDEPPQVPGVRVEAIAGRFELYDEQGVRRVGPALRFALALMRALATRRGSFDAVYVSALPSLNVPAAWLGLAGSRTQLITEWVEVWRLGQWVQYSGGPVGLLAWLAQALGILLSRRSVVNSQLMAGRLRSLRYRGRLFVSPGLLPDDDLDRAPRFDPPEVPRLVFAGRHIPDKRIELIPEVVARLRADGVPVTAAVVGDGPARAGAVERARELGVADVCTFPGFVDQAELDELMAGSSCLLNPSVREGYGLVVVEAAAAATPSVVVIAPDNAAAELVTDGVNGYVADGPEVGAVVRAVTAVLHGGAELRRSTRRWFDESARHGTVRNTARQLLPALVGDRAG
jgi:glycosyltransferase involved in cell wall biosynthesis